MKITAAQRRALPRDEDRFRLLSPSKRPALPQGLVAPLDFSTSRALIRRRLDLTPAGISARAELEKEG